MLVSAKRITLLNLSRCVASAAPLTVLDSVLLTTYKGIPKKLLFSDVAVGWQKVAVDVKTNSKTKILSFVVV